MINIYSLVNRLFNAPTSVPVVANQVADTLELSDRTLRDQPDKLRTRLHTLHSIAAGLRLDVDAFSQAYYHTDLLSLTIHQYSQLLSALKLVSRDSKSWMNSYKKHKSPMQSLVNKGWDVAYGIPQTETKDEPNPVVAQIVARLKQIEQQDRE